MGPPQAQQDPSSRGSKCTEWAEGNAEMILKTVRGVLNKLTPEKFEALMKRVDDLVIDSEKLLRAVVKLIVDKAVVDHECSIYAEMCHHMKGLTVTSQNKDGCVSFLTLLVSHCQREFQNNELFNEKNREMTNRKAHERLLGIVRFISELFNLNLVQAFVIHSCAITFIKDEREVTLECLCKLLSMAGEGLEPRGERQKLHKYISYIFHMQRHENTSARLRCDLMELFELWKNKWVPRGQEAARRTNEQVPQIVESAGGNEQPQFMIKGILKKGNIRDRREKRSVYFQDEKRQTGNQPKFASTVAVEPRNEETQEESPVPETPHLEMKVEEDNAVGDVSMSLKTLLQEDKKNTDIEDWIQNNLNLEERSSEDFIRALMRSVAESVIDTCGIHKVDGRKMHRRADLLRKYLSSDQHQLVALNALKELVLSMEKPRFLLRWLFDMLLDEDVVQDTVFFRWETSADAETLASVSKFFAFLRKAGAK